MTQNTKVKFTDEQLEKLRRYRNEMGFDSLRAALVYAVSNTQGFVPSQSPTKGRKAVCMRLGIDWMDGVRHFYKMPFQQVVASVLDYL